jgi:hypothetical protein
MSQLEDGGSKLIVRARDPGGQALCAVMFCVGVGAAVLGKYSASENWPLFVIASILFWVGFNLLMEILRNDLFEIVAEPTALRWGRVDGKQRRIAAAEIAILSFEVGTDQDGATAELLSGERVKLPEEIIGNDHARTLAFAKACAAVWPNIEVTVGHDRLG